MRTDNLFIAVAVHALGNAPTTLFATSPLLDGAGASLLIYALAALGIFVLPVVRSRLLHRNIGYEANEMMELMAEYGEQEHHALCPPQANYIKNL
jgi:acyl-CoA synthetase (AMP-forming)/AMP-acid ligase II